MFPPAVAHLRCPHCGSDLSLSGRTIGCGRGHRFDLARQGYVSLLPGKPVHTGDSARMVAARARLLARGHLAPIGAAVASCVEEALARPRNGAHGRSGCVADLGAGTGEYLARVLDRLPDRPGLALDASRYACRRAAKAHPRIGAVVCDIWRRLPVRTAAAAAVLDIFAPRNGQEIRRILRPDGVLVVVTPTARHLAELVEPLGLVTVDTDKEQRVAAELDPHLAPVRRAGLEHEVVLDHAAARDVVAMGPSAHHLDENDLALRVARLAQRVVATVSVTVSLHRRR